MVLGRKLNKISNNNQKAMSLKSNSSKNQQILEDKEGENQEGDDILQPSFRGPQNKHSHHNSHDMIDQFFAQEMKMHVDSENCCKFTRQIIKSRLHKGHRQFKSTLNGRKNIAKYFGLQLKKYFQKIHPNSLVQTNQSIQTFNRGCNHSNQCFRELAKDEQARVLAMKFLNSDSPIIYTMGSRKISDKRWSIKRISFFLRIFQRASTSPTTN